MTAGDWIKLRDDTPESAEVMAIADILNMDELDVLGRIVRVWTWADRRSEGGELPGLTKRLLDRLVRRDGFADAMICVGWLEERGGALWLPDFERIGFNEVDRYIPRRIRDQILSEGECAHCGSDRRLEVDHIRPLSLGGSNAVDNLQALCMPCNRSKGARFVG